MIDRTRKQALSTLIIGAIAAGGTAAPDGNGASTPNVDLPRYPSVSPDGTRLVFSWRGDLWIAPIEGGTAARLTAHPADELRSAWSPDGSTIVFESGRDGVRNLWAMFPDGTGVRQLTTLDMPVTLSAVGRTDDENIFVTFDANRENDLYRAPRPYRVPLEGGRVERLFDAFGTSATPSLDGSRFLFERGGASWSRRGYRGPDARDVWLFDARDGSFRRLTAWEGNDGGAQWASALVSLRGGGIPMAFDPLQGDFVYLSDAVDGVVNVLRRPVAAAAEEPGVPLTRLERDARDLTVSADGRTAVFGSWGKLYRLDLTAAEPAPIAIPLTAAEDALSDTTWRRIDRDVSDGALNPDGSSVAIVAYGDVFIRSTEEKALPVRITDTPWGEREIAWSPDGLTLYFTADEHGKDEIRAAKVRRTRADVRRAFEESNAAATDGSAEQSDDRDADDETAPEEGKGAESGADASAAGAAGADADKSAEADKPADDGASASGDAKSKRKSGDWADAIEFDIETIVDGTDECRTPTPSPDGKSLLYRRGGGDLVLRHLERGDDRVVREGWDRSIAWRFSPDGRWIAFQQQDRDFNSDIWIVPSDGSAEPVNVTRHPDSDVDPRWSADGRILAFRSDRVNNEFDVWAVWLDRSLEGRTPAELEKYFKEAVESVKKRKPLGAAASPARGGAKGTGSGAEADEGAADEPRAAAGDDAETTRSDADAPARDREKREARRKKAPPVLSLDDAYLRVRRITTLPENEGQLEMTPGGDRIIFSSQGRSELGDDEEPGARGSLNSVKWDGTDQKRLGAGGSVQHVSLTGDKVLVVRGGSLSTVPPSGGETKNIDFAASTLIDRREQMRRRFLGVSRALGEGFYHPTMKGLDWKALTERYLELAMAARTSDEFNDVAARFIGELNASHLGVSAPADGSIERRPQGRLGVRSRPTPDGFEIVQIYPDGPAAKSPTPLREGDVVIAVAGRPASEAATLEELFTARVGEETLVRVRRAGTAPGGAIEIDALVVPVSSGEQAALAYRATRLANAAEVDRLSGGRLGYIHIQGMSQPSLDEFERDLYAAAEGREGLIIDVRNNGGGWTADRLLASIMAPVHAYTVPRGADPAYTLGYPRDRLFIQRYPLPINMLANEKSFSNAEIIAHAFKTLGRGTLVGETTNGGVISTGGVRLLDGTSVRMPFRGWYLTDGTDMENHGAVPDLRVPQTPEDESRGEDAQLRRAVEDLLSRLGPVQAQAKRGVGAPK